ncbi:MAG TPA: sigma-70 family RNA polymerase sigma factor [Chitinophagaceae bacterium]|nr:sigma-70 family RNA polymerase sigma factor [Chitinophagaceae bacterium]
MELAVAYVQDDIVARCLQGDTSCYTTLYKRYATSMFNTALRIVNNRKDAEDVLQEAFSDAFGNLTSFNFTSTFGAWLKKIVVNRSLNYLRKNKMLVIDASEAVIENIPVDEMIDETHIHLQVAKIKKAMQELNDGQRTVLTLYLFEGYDHEEISEILNVPPVTVRSQYMRAKQKLLTLLKPGSHE